jgi:copper type II ascorbate-dependent monooxygenase-like protein
VTLMSTVGCSEASQPPHENASRASPGDEESGSPAEGCEAIDLAPPRPGEGIQVSIDMQLAPGEERQLCKLVLTGNAVNLNWSEGVYTKGSHHGLTARTTYRDALPVKNIRGEDVDPSIAADCESIGSDWDVQAVIAGGHAVGEPAATTLNTKGTLPDDVALKVADNEVLEVNFHMQNTTERPLHACYKQNLYGIPDDQVKAEAGTMFYYNPFITIPAGGRSTATMACPVSSDVRLAAQVSHMHRRGRGYRATLLDGDPLSGGKAVSTLYEGTDWAEPIAKIDDPAVALSTGQWIQWSCDFVNPENRNVAQGQQTTDEMCMFIGTYWPRSAEMDACERTGMTPFSAGRILAEGTKSGADVLDCWNQSPKLFGGGGPESSADRYASQRCITDACAKASGRAYDIVTGAVDPNTITCD